MKPARIKAEQERLAAVKMRRWARKIPDNAMLTSILLQFPEKPFRRALYDKLAPHLKFEPIPIGVINGDC